MKIKCGAEIALRSIAHPSAPSRVYSCFNVRRRLARNPLVPPHRPRSRAHPCAKRTARSLSGGTPSCPYRRPLDGKPRTTGWKNFEWGPFCSPCPRPSTLKYLRRPYAASNKASFVAGLSSGRAGTNSAAAQHTGKCRDSQECFAFLARCKAFAPKQISAPHLLGCDQAIQCGCSARPPQPIRSQQACSSRTVWRV